MLQRVAAEMAALRRRILQRMSLPIKTALVTQNAAKDNVPFHREKGRNAAAS